MRTFLDQATMTAGNLKVLSEADAFDQLEHDVSREVAGLEDAMKVAVADLAGGQVSN